MTLKDLTILLVCLNSTGSSFIYFTEGGELRLEDCKIGIADVFTSWERERRAWNGTFMTLNGSSFYFKNTKFSDIFINDTSTEVETESGKNEIRDTNTFLLSLIKSGTEFSIDNCTFTRCGCLGVSKNDYGSPMNIEIESGGRLDIINTSFEGFSSGVGKVQALYIKAAKYDPGFHFVNVAFSSSSTSETIVFIDMYDPCSLINETINNNTIKNEFEVLCDILNETNALLNNIALKKLVCNSNSNDCNSDNNDCNSNRTNCNIFEEICLWLEENVTSEIVGQCYFKVDCI
jgi:hypothetical protein